MGGVAGHETIQARHGQFPRTCIGIVHNTRSTRRSMCRGFCTLVLFMLPQQALCFPNRESRHCAGETYKVNGGNSERVGNSGHSTTHVYITNESCMLDILILCKEEPEIRIPPCKV